MTVMPPTDPRNQRVYGLALVLLLALATCAGMGCATCALPHEHVQVLAEQAERFVELDEIEHEQGLTKEQLERKRTLGDRLRARAGLAKRGLAVEGKLEPAVGDAELDRGDGK